MKKILLVLILAIPLVIQIAEIQIQTITALFMTMSKQAKTTIIQITTAIKRAKML